MLARVRVRRTEMTHMLSTPAVLNRPVQGVTGWRGTQKANRETKTKQQKQQSQQQQQQPQPPHQHQQRQHQSGGNRVVGPRYRLDPVHGQWRWDDSKLTPFGNAGRVPPMGYVPVQPPPGALPPRPLPRAGSEPQHRGTPMASRLCFKCQRPGHYSAQYTAHVRAHVAQNYPPSSGYFGAHAASFTPPPAGRSIPRALWSWWLRSD